MRRSRRRMGPFGPHVTSRWGRLAPAAGALAGQPPKPIRARLRGKTMKVNFTGAPAIGHGHKSRPGSAARLHGLVLTAGLVGAVVAGTAGTASAAVKVSPTVKASTVAAVTASNPPVGSYTARNPQNNYPITFYVSSGQT